jgi:two-component system osmolarity sensor histidine kinase EnvZ
MARFSLIYPNFWRPFQKFKPFLPKTLLGRSLTILITPIVLVQLITGYVFWDRHWSKHTDKLADHMTSNIAGVLDMIHAIPGLPGQMSYIEGFARHHFDMTLIRRSPYATFSKELLAAEGWRERIIREALAQKISYHFRLRVFDDVIKIEVATLRGVFEFSMNKRILFPKSTPIVIWWEIGAPLFFILIAFIFMRNQMRPLQTLSGAVEAFGKGRNNDLIKPAGAIEIRRVGRAFNEMRDRIQRQITQRTEMLAGISHDIKTPLTRMELQLAMLKASPAVQALLADVKEMEKMVEEYLAFARGEEAESPTPQNIFLLIREVAQKLDPSSLYITLPPEETLIISLRPNAFKRALKNLISNALRYGKQVWISLSSTPKTITLIIDDNGPGIPLEKREDVFRPFVRLDESRNPQTGGYGLGLSITKDIITTHGGTIFLSDSYRGGLRVVVNLPI